MLKRNFHINVNGRFGTRCWVTLYICWQKKALAETLPSSELLATPRPDVGILCCKTVAVVEVADVVAFTVPAALSAG